ncbi:hypothetical protein Tco_0580819 [Tanacetum coccineum]
MLLETKGLTSDTILTTLAIPSTMIGGRDVERDQRLRFDGFDDEESNHENVSDTCATPKQQQQVIPQTTTISNIKLPILKKEEYDIWAMEMEHYLEYIDNDVWKVILNGNSKKRISTGKDGVIRILSPITAAEIQAVEKERKAKNILLKKIQEAVFQQQLKHFKYPVRRLEQGYGYIPIITILSRKLNGAKYPTEDANHKVPPDHLPSMYLPLLLIHQPIFLEKRSSAGFADEIAMIAIRMKKFYKKTRRRVRVDGKTPIGFDKKKLECFNCPTLVNLARKVQQRGHIIGKKKERTHINNINKLEAREESDGLLTIDDGWLGCGLELNSCQLGENILEVKETNHALMAISSSNEIFVVLKLA